MPDEELARVFDAQIPGVTDRENGSPYYITKVPDLIGILNRKYIDHTATHQHRGSADLMRYAALVEYSDRTFIIVTPEILLARHRKLIALRLAIMD
jgi:hypothetical protein